MNTSLPIYEFKDQIIDAVNKHDVTIIDAETGSGKSTQVCQYLFEEDYRVIVTEPRRLAARSIPMRVAQEMGVRLGTTVGYRTAFERFDSLDTRILFCTDGIQLMRELKVFQHGTTDEKKVLCIDECHEWNNNMEALVANSKLQMSAKIPMKVCIMSATMEADELMNYFGQKNVALIKIPGRCYPVEAHYETCINREHSFRRAKEKALEMVRNGKNIEVFLPGKKEIYDFIEDLKRECVSGVRAVLLPLHAELSPEEQQDCFNSYDLPKVIVATNVAQTGVTVPDIDVVIDIGIKREPQGVFGIMTDVTISKAEVAQRKGRAGRTHEGEYWLFSEVPYEEMPDYPVPEIQRTMLENLVLNLMNVGLDPEELDFFHQPSKDAIRKAKELLVKLGALEKIA